MTPDEDNLDQTEPDVDLDPPEPDIPEDTGIPYEDEHDDFSPWADSKWERQRAEAIRIAHLLALPTESSEELYVPPRPNWHVYNVADLRYGPPDLDTIKDVVAKRAADPYLGLRVYVRPGGFPPLELWSPWIIERMILETPKVVTELVKAQKHRFMDFALAGVRIALKEMFMARYPAARRQSLVDWFANLPDSDDLDNTSCVCQVALAEYLRGGQTPEEWQETVESFNKATLWIARWAAMSFTHEPMDWVPALAATIDYSDKIKRAAQIPDEDYTVQETAEILERDALPPTAPLLVKFKARSPFSLKKDIQEVSSGNSITRTGSNPLPNAESILGHRVHQPVQTEDRRADGLTDRRPATPDVPASHRPGFVFKRRATGEETSGTED